MGQKVNPVGFRVGIVRDWESTWYADKDYQRFLHEDLRIRKFLPRHHPEYPMGCAIVVDLPGPAACSLLAGPLKTLSTFCTLRSFYLHFGHIEAIFTMKDAHFGAALVLHQCSFGAELDV